MDFQAISGRAIAGDAHFFDDATSPAKVRQFLDSSKVSGLLWIVNMKFYLSIGG